MTLDRARAGLDRVGRALEHRAVGHGVLIAFALFVVVMATTAEQSPTLG
jgi:hypothetical protein